MPADIITDSARKPPRLPELLSPAGGPEALAAALRGGADAVYLGGRCFNARMNAANFDDRGLECAVRDAHRAGARIYVTLNTLVLEREYGAALSYVRFLSNAGVDALITADPGLSREIRLNFPELELHASTQAGAHSAACVRALAELGFSRVVAARELSLDNIKKLTGTGTEIEIFIHGALCVSHSGQCLFSSLVGGRSGNRGECAQPCRLSYNGGYPLSLKDNCLAGHIRDIISSGAASLKIEGRMKSPEYVYSVTAAWRRLLDSRSDATPAQLDSLARVFSRSGFTDGYFTGRIGGHMNGVRSEQDKRRTASVHTAKQGAPLPTREPLRTPARADREPVLHPFPASDAPPRMTARFTSPEQIPRVNPFEIVYLPLERFDPSRANGVVIPPVVTDAEEPAVLSALCAAAAAGARHALVGNIGHIAYARAAGLTAHGDFRLGAYSAESAGLLMSLGLEDIIFSPELTIVQLRDIRCDRGAVVYGRIPLMLLEKRLGTAGLRDRRGVLFPVIREGGRDIVLNSAVTYMADKEDSLRRAGIAQRHFIFTDEKADRVARVIGDYARGRPASAANIRRIREK